MCSRKWLMPLSSRVSNLEPTRAQSATCARCSHGWGATMVRSPLPRVVVRHAVAKFIGDDAMGFRLFPRRAIRSSRLVFVFRWRADAAIGSLRLLDVRLVHFDVVLCGSAEPLHVEREGLVALAPHELLLECRAVLLEVLPRRRLVLLQLHDDESV